MNVKFCPVGRPPDHGQNSKNESNFEKSFDIELCSENYTSRADMNVKLCPGGRPPDHIFENIIADQKLSYNGCRNQEGKGGVQIRKASSTMMTTKIRHNQFCEGCRNQEGKGEVLNKKNSLNMVI